MNVKIMNRSGEVAAETEIGLQSNHMLAKRGWMQLHFDQHVGKLSVEDAWVSIKDNQGLQSAFDLHAVDLVHDIETISEAGYDWALNDNLREKAQRRIEKIHPKAAINITYHSEPKQLCLRAVFPFVNHHTVACNYLNEKLRDDVNLIARIFMQPKAKVDAH